MSDGNKKLKELREKLDSELVFDVGQLQKELFELRFKSSAEGLGNPARICELRREIARAKTILTERRQGIRGAAVRT
jgi:large subunit ribosomal protein L29